MSATCPTTNVLVSRCKKLQRHDCLIFFQFPVELAAKLFINRSQLAARIAPFENIKVFADRTSIQIEAHRSSGTPTATAVYAKSKDTANPLPRGFLDKLPSLEVDKPVEYKTVDLDASSSLSPAATQNQLHVMSPQVASLSESKGEHDEDGEIPRRHLNGPGKPTNTEPVNGTSNHVPRKIRNFKVRHNRPHNAD